MDQIKSLIRTIPDHPQKGIEFRDLTTLFIHAQGFEIVIRTIVDRYRDTIFDKVVGVESRGFIVAAPVAYALSKGFVPVRKPGKLPGPTVGMDYQLEYGTDRLEIHSDSLNQGDRILMVDDLLATGGTMEAACKLVEQVGGEIIGCAFVVELVDLKGRQRLTKYPLFKLVDFEGD